MSYYLRYRALYERMDNYTCCSGYLPCSGKCGEASCPQCCLCTESTICFPTSVIVTRFMIQDDLLIQNSKCDNCLMAFTFCMQQLACICTIIAMLTNDDSIDQAANMVDIIADVVWCSVCACMQTQHKIQLDARDEGLTPHGRVQETAYLAAGGSGYSTNEAPYYNHGGYYNHDAPSTTAPGQQQPPYAQPAYYGQDPNQPPYAQPTNYQGSAPPPMATPVAPQTYAPVPPMAQPAYAPVPPMAQPVVAPAASANSAQPQPPQQQSMN
jgi:hypothetical protein